MLLDRIKKIIDTIKNDREEGLSNEETCVNYVNEIMLRQQKCPIVTICLSDGLTWPTIRLDYASHGYLLRIPPGSPDDPEGQKKQILHLAIFVAVASLENEFIWEFDKYSSYDELISENPELDGCILFVEDFLQSLDLPIA